MLGDKQAHIKLENEKWSKLQARLKVAKSGKGVLDAYEIFLFFSTHVMHSLFVICFLRSPRQNGE